MSDYQNGSNAKISMVLVMGLIGFGAVAEMTGFGGMTGQATGGGQGCGGEIDEAATAADMDQPLDLQVAPILRIETQEVHPDCQVAGDEGYLKPHGEADVIFDLGQLDRYDPYVKPILGFYTAKSETKLVEILASLGLEKLEHLKNLSLRPAMLAAAWIAAQSGNIPRQFLLRPGDVGQEWTQDYNLLYTLSDDAIELILDPKLQENIVMPSIANEFQNETVVDVGSPPSRPGAQEGEVTTRLSAILDAIKSADSSLVSAESYIQTILSQYEYLMKVKSPMLVDGKPAIWAMGAASYTSGERILMVSNTGDREITWKPASSLAFKSFEVYRVDRRSFKRPVVSINCMKLGIFDMGTLRIPPGAVEFIILEAR